MESAILTKESSSLSDVGEESKSPNHYPGDPKAFDFYAA